MSEVKTVKIADIKTNPYQPRSFFDSAAIEELAVSIKENGLVQPITLRKSDNGYELIAGERRLRACISLEYDEIPANVIESSDDDSMYMALIENIQREDLSSIEEAKAYMRIMEMKGMTQKELAMKIGKSQPSIANKIRLLNLDNNVQNAVESKLISERHARALLSLDKAQQNVMLDEIIKNQLSVAETEKMLKPKERKQINKKSGKGLSRQVQIGINTLKQAKTMVERSGLEIMMSEEDKDEYVEIIFKIKK